VEAAVAERQRLGADDRAQRERCIKVRKQRAAARALPFQRGAKPVAVDADEDEIARAGEMPGRRFGDLRGGGEVNEAVGKIDRGAAKYAAALGLPPQRGGTDFIKGGQRSGRAAQRLAAAGRRDRRAVGGILVELVAQAADRDAEDVRGVGAVTEAVLKRLEDEVTLDFGDGASDQIAGESLGGERGVADRAGAAVMLEPRAVRR